MEKNSPEIRQCASSKMSRFACRARDCSTTRNSGFKSPPQLNKFISYKLKKYRKILTKNFCYFIGAMQGDGSQWNYQNKNGKIRNGLSLFAIDREMVDKVSMIFNKTFNKNTNVFIKSDGLF